MSAQKTFWTKFEHEFDRLPTWVLGTSMEIGDVGTVDRRGFTKLANLASFGVAMNIVVDKIGASYFVVSDAAKAWTGGLAAHSGSLIGPMVEANGELKAEFSEAGAFIVRADSVTSRRMDNILDVENEIRKFSWEQEFWHKRWIYVTEVVTAKPCVVLVSDNNAASASVTVEATGPAPLGDPRGEMFLKLGHSSGMNRTLVSNHRVPFMWRGRSQSRWTAKFGDLGEDLDDIKPDDFIWKVDPSWLDEDWT